MPGYPIQFKDIFTNIPSYVQHIDAAYEREADGSIILFHGEFQIYVFYTL